MNHAPRNTIEDLAYFDRATDIAGCDIYPVPESDKVGHSDLANRTLSCVGAYTDRMQEAAPGKPIWMVLQGTGWGDFGEHGSEAERALLRRPKQKETRFMAYDAIVHGARGILYWGTHYVEKDSEFWRELLGVTAELNRLQPVLSAPDAELPALHVGPTNGSLDHGPKILSKSTPEGDWHLVVNEWSGPLQVSLDLKNASGYRALETDTVLKVEGSQLTLFMPGYSVVVLAPK